MNAMKAVLWGVLALFSFCTSAVESLPTKVDYTETVAAAKKAVEAGREGKPDLLIQFTEEALKYAKKQSKIRTTAAAQRITEHLRAALQKAKEGKLEEATALIQEEIAEMK
jgi:DNA-directed RNA polymerase subunit F